MKLKNLQIAVHMVSQIVCVLRGLWNIAGPYIDAAVTLPSRPMTVASRSTMVGRTGTTRSTAALAVIPSAASEPAHCGGLSINTMSARHLPLAPAPPRGGLPLPATPPAPAPFDAHPSGRPSAAGNRSRIAMLWFCAASGQRRDAARG